MSAIIQTGKIVDVITLLTISALSFFFIWQIKKGLTINLQRMPAVDAIEESIGRAVEMGRPVHYTTGMGELKDSAVTGEKTVSFYIMENVAEICATQHAKMFVSESDPLALGYITDTLRSAYDKQGWSEGFNDNNIQWYPWTTMAFALPNTFQVMKPGANFMLGNIQFGTIIIAEAGALQGAFQIGYGQTEFLMATCEYVLIADELYATSAYMSKKQSIVASIAGNDYVKMITLAVLIISLVLFNLNIGSVINWLKL